MARRKSNKQVKAMLDLYAGRAGWKTGVAYTCSAGYTHFEKSKHVVKANY